MKFRLGWGRGDAGYGTVGKGTKEERSGASAEGSRVSVAERGRTGPACPRGACWNDGGTAAGAAGEKTIGVGFKLGRSGANIGCAAALPAAVWLTGSTGASPVQDALPAWSKAAARSIRWFGCWAIIMLSLCLGVGRVWLGRLVLAGRCGT